MIKELITIPPTAPLPSPMYGQRIFQAQNKHKSHTCMHTYTCSTTNVLACYRAAHSVTSYLSGWGAHEWRLLFSEFLLNIFADDVNTVIRID